MLPPWLLRPLVVALAFLALVAPATAAAQSAALANDPVLVELGAVKERASAVQSRFVIAVRGLAVSQGAMYSLELLEQVYGFFPQFLEQRGSELALLEAARGRGIRIDDAEVDALIGQAQLQYPDEDTFLQALESAGFGDVGQLREAVREDATVRALMASIESQVVLGDLEVRVAYEALKPQLLQPGQVCARHILVSDEAGAAALARAARGGADFAAMAATASIDPSSSGRGGDLGCFGPGVMVAEFEAAAFAAEVGVATVPVQSSFGYHVILVERRIAPHMPTLDEVRLPLEQQLRSERVDAVVQAILQLSGVRTYPERIPSFAEAFGDTD